jgi:hypothetical protein
MQSGNLSLFDDVYHLEKKMSHMHKKHIYTFFLFVFAVLMFSQAGCDSMLPSQYKSGVFQPDAIDAHAASVLETSLLDSLGRITDSTHCKIISLRSVRSMVNGVARDTLTENQIVTMNFNQFGDSLPLLVRDSLLLMKYSQTERIVYGALRVTASDPKDVYLYTSLCLNDTNYQQYVVVELVKQDTMNAVVSNSLEFAAVSGSTQIISISGNPTIVATINGRYRIHLTEGLYYVRFIISNPSIVRPFKVLILSI